MRLAGAADGYFRSVGTNFRSASAENLPQGVSSRPGVLLSEQSFAKAALNSAHGHDWMGAALRGSGRGARAGSGDVAGNAFRGIPGSGRNRVLLGASLVARNSVRSEEG